jgi:hypothetical protein
VLTGAKNRYRPEIDGAVDRELECRKVIGLTFDQEEIFQLVELRVGCLDP